MVTELQKTSLYEQDFLLWSEETATKLRAKDFANLDRSKVPLSQGGQGDLERLAGRLPIGLGPIPGLHQLFTNHQRFILYRNGRIPIEVNIPHGPEFIAQFPGLKQNLIRVATAPSQ